MASAGSPVRFAHVALDGPVSAAAAAFWAGALGGTWGDADPGSGWVATLRPEAGDAYVHESGAGSPAALTLEVDEPERTAERLVGLGATRSSGPGPGPVVLVSPGGLPFGLVEVRSVKRPPVHRWADGSLSRLVQVCLDCPPDGDVAEAGFWAAATGWSWQPCHSPEFVCHLVPDAGPLQLLVQRRDGAEPADVTRHLDLGTSNREAEAARLVGLGASRLATGRGWVVLADPDGRVFCATGLPPDAPP